MSGRRFLAALQLFRTTATPIVEQGDVWWRSDLSQAHAWDGATSGDAIQLGPTGNAPVIRSGAWHGFPAYGSNTSANVPDGRLFAVPFWPGRATTVTAIAANVTLALVGGNIRFGLYANAGAVPGNLVADWGTVATGVTGISSVTGLNVPVRPVLHWLVVARQGGVLNLGLSSRASWDPLVAEASPTIGADLNAYYRDGVTGALPASFGAVAGTIQGPSLNVQLT